MNTISKKHSLSAPILIEGLSDIADRYDHFILDIYGVIHDGIQPFPRTIDTLEKLKRAGKQTCLLSNSPRREDNVVSHLYAMGIDRNLYDHIVTSGEATYLSMRNRDHTFGDDCWFIGTPHGSEVLEGQSLNILRGPEGASFIVNSIPGSEGLERQILISKLEYAAQAGLPMICANPDLVVNIGTQQYECAGTFAALYEQLGGKVIYHGKPHEPVYKMCYDLLGQPDKPRLCAVGDSFHTDIAGANTFGIDSVLNLVGIHWDEIETNGKPDHKKLQNLLDNAPTHPTYLMTGFAW